MKKIETNIIVDRLEITFQATEGWKKHFESVAEDHVERRDQLILERKSCEMYKNEYNVFCYNPNGVKCLIGLLYWGSVRKHRQNVYFSYFNKALYDDFLLASRFYIEEALGLTFIRVSKIDIAIDANVNIVSRFYKFLRDSSYDLVLNGRKTSSDMDAYLSDIDGHYVGSRSKPYKFKTFYVHNKKHTLEMRGYNKSLEIKEKSGKTYIEQVTGFGNIYRLEVTCKNYKQLAKSFGEVGIEYDDEIFSKLQTESFLFSLFESISNRLIRYRKQRTTYSLTDLIFPTVFSRFKTI